jgi:hypothetical protein
VGLSQLGLALYFGFEPPIAEPAPAFFHESLAQLAPLALTLSRAERTQQQASRLSKRVGGWLKKVGTAFALILVNRCQLARRVLIF